jgi:hypothetical protein
VIVRLFVLAVAAGVLALGLGCLNYTNAWNVDHHTEWATELGLPAPSEQLLQFGMGATAVGGILVGLVLRKRKR